MEIKTHLGIDRALCGQPLALEEGRAQVELELRPEMAVDERGLVHGGFIFGAADYAAMLAVNDPYVVSGSAQTRFLKPCRVGEKVRFEAQLQEAPGRKKMVQVQGWRGEVEIFTGSFTCFVLDKHVLEV